MNKQAQKYKNPKRQDLQDKKENLFKAKKEWNSYLKEFREELKRTQALINGRVEGRDRIKLYEQLPEDSVSSLMNLAEVFSKRMEQGAKISEYQNAYSDEYQNFYNDLEMRRQEKLKSLAPTPAQQIPGSEGEGKRASKDYNLLKEGGISDLGLFWEKIKSFPSLFFSANESTRRITLLTQLKDIDKKMSDLELMVQRARTSQDLTLVRKVMASTYRSCRALSNIVESMARVNEFGVDGEGQELTSKKAPQERLESIKEDISHFPFLEIRMTLRKSELNLDESTFDKIKKIKLEVDGLLLRIESNPRVRRYYDLLAEKYDELIRVCFGNSAYNSFQDYKSALSRKEANVNYQIIKIAEDDPYDSKLLQFKKWLASLGLKINPFLKIRGNLEDTKFQLKQCRESLNQPINEIKSGEINLVSLKTSLDTISSSIQQLIGNVDDISSLLAEGEIDYETFSKADKRVDQGWMTKLLKGVKERVWKKEQ